MSTVIVWQDAETRVTAAWHKDSRPTVVRYGAPFGPQLNMCHEESRRYYATPEAAVRAAKRLAARIRRDMRSNGQ
jgi:hypothetical protein